ncbi:hypothetical protein PtA15_17A213 [Puccinia triticina]|uniref:Zinc-finger domain-containing protein n=1 Tax=Puccinia triticina TaxID=208348 RepID=A0ABY7D5T0_9BASI|nr:uncharacterized protein PtA15_17A213 [Puccinia triticina]WAQ92731.1 hypothetical protein PtA15_17A213 [Puccinia triticina]
MPRRRSSNRCSTQSIATSHETGVAANTSSDEALECYALRSDNQETPANTWGTFTSDRPPKPPPNGIRPTNSPSIMGQTPGDNKGIETIGSVTLDRLFGGDSSARRTSRKRKISTLPPPATEPDERGRYEASTCHQCRTNTTRPKMICDQSQDPYCFIRVCDRCLTGRAVHEGIPELQPPLFEFVPGGRMLCLKCRGICPCASCRRNRSENEEIRRGRNSFQGLKSQGRKPGPKKKQSRTAPVKRYILSAGGDKVPANMHGQLIQAGPTTLRALTARDYAEPKSIPDRPAKAKPGAKKLVNQCLSSQARKEIGRDVDTTLMNQLIQSNKRLTEAASDMSSVLQRKDSPSDSKTSDHALP